MLGKRPLLISLIVPTARSIRIAPLLEARGGGHFPFPVRLLALLLLQECVDLAIRRRGLMQLISRPLEASIRVVGRIQGLSEGGSSRREATYVPMRRTAVLWRRRLLRLHWQEVFIGVL